MAASSVITPFSRDGSSGLRCTFSTSGRTEATTSPEALIEEDSLQVNIHIIKLGIGHL
jgi:hypothetical protein